VAEINTGYPNLFDEGGASDKGPDEAGGGNDGNTGVSGFADRWGWVAHVDGVSETMRQSWDATFRMPVLEFLNVVSYRRDKAEEERRRIEQWKKRN
jgi:hypothetical protein